MTGKEKVRAYIVEPLLATITLAVLKDFFSFSDLALFMHGEARDALSLLVVLLASGLALWVGLFWVSNTPFGAWLTQKGELDAFQSTYMAAIAGTFSACIGCLLAAYLDARHVIVQIVALWITMFALYGLPVLLNNTKLLLKLHAVFSLRSQKMTMMDRQAEK